MKEQKECEKCSFKDSCKDVYNKLGSYKGESVFLKVLEAFLIPMIVFAASLTAFDKIFSEIIESDELKIILSLLSALIITFLAIFILKIIIWFFRKITG